MKGFPNQFSDLKKLAGGLRVLSELVDTGKNAKDYQTYGIALVKAGVMSTAHGKVKKPVDVYLKEQLAKRATDQTIQTTPRGMRELYRLMGLIDDGGPTMVITDQGRRAAQFAGKPWDDEQIAFWRGVINGIETEDDHGNSSHPYQVLLRLVARKPNIARAETALALEARDDSPKEIDRIVALADLDEEDILAKIKETKSNWDNAKKLLPSFAEQLGDVIRTKGRFVLADAPGKATEAGPAAATAEKKPAKPKAAAPKAPKSSREVTPETIGKAGTEEKFGDVPLPPPGDPVAMAAAIKSRGERLKRHNLMVKAFAALLNKAGGKLYEDPFDILVVLAESGVLVEAKTLDGSVADERDRVREAFSQLLYYESFLTAAVAGEAPICKIALFEKKISDEHAKWLNKFGMAAVWKDGDQFTGDDLARDFLGKLVPEFK